MKAIVVKYHGPTNTKGSRYSATAEGVARLYMSKDYSLNSDECKHEAAKKLCTKMCWPTNLIEGTLPNGDSVFVFDLANLGTNELYKGLDS